MALIGSDSSLALSSELTNSAAAPSEIEEELAAVTVPSFLNAGFKFGIFSGCAFLGCSSSLMVMSPFLVLMVTGEIYLSKAFFFCADRALFNEPMAYSSCCSLVNWNNSAVSSAYAPINLPGS